MDGLSAAEQSVYDRQLRVWGLETQQKLRNSKVLIVGCTGLSAEVAKNIVLAGVGSVTLVDDTLCSSREHANFLVPYDADPSHTVAEASVATLQDMNPLVTVAAAAGTPSTFVTAGSVAGYNLVLVVGQSANVVHQADVVCAEAGVPFMAGSSKGFSGWAFANLHDFKYIVEDKKEDSDGTVKKSIEHRSLQGVAWQAALTAVRPKANIKRMSPLLNVLRVCGKFEVAEQRAAQLSDVPILEAALQKLCADEGLVGAKPEDLGLAAYVEHSEEMPAINAVLGGVVANDVIKVVASKGEPIINNMFLYSLFDGAGWVERLEAPAV